MKPMQHSIFTIGHSTHSQERFIELLKLHGITAVCDVRSKPYSRWNPQFNRETLKEALRSAGIAYVFLGKELGARSDDPSCYADGRVQYDRLALTQTFKQGLERVQEGMEKYRLAVMCAEKEPLECHRTILVSRCLETRGIDVQHIHADGRLERHADTIDRLMRELKIRDDDMFRSREEVVADAYKKQEERIAYSERPSGEAEPEPARSVNG
ncbi:MAG TPA: DUF488 domain-containing protein [Bryobacteraceae bacterium]|nr:DUF488 domain-containing protein [Bryobacteraceae bacterium]